MIRAILSSALFSVLLAFVCLPFAAHAADPVQHGPAQAYFVNLKDGDTVTSPVKVVFGLKGMNVAPAGTPGPNTGHFHLLIDTTLTEEQKKSPIPNDDQHLHFGKGQKEAVVDLKPGKHTLQIVMGDGQHMLHNPPVMSAVITVTAEHGHFKR